MGEDRLDILINMVERKPDDSFARYGLAMEYKNRGNLALAVEQFRALIGLNPNYAAAYYHGGQALEKAGKLEDARQIYRSGIDVTTRLGDDHTRSEIQAALDLL